MGNEGIMKDEVSKVITNTLEGMGKFESKLKLSKRELTDIKNIEDELRSIINQLDDIKKIINKVAGLYAGLEIFLEQKQDDLERSNFALLKYRKKQIITLVDENLPDEMEVRKLENNEDKWKIVLLSDINIDLIDGRKKSKYTDFYKKQEETIGEMLLTEVEDELLIRIKMQDESVYQDFKVDNALKVFPIVNYIITKYNYKEEMVPAN